jgi:hypothetical protein
MLHQGISQHAPQPLGCAAGSDITRPTHASAPQVRQRNGPPEQVAVADMIFDVLKDAWNTFQATGK